MQTGMLQLKNMATGEQQALMPADIITSIQKPL
jgi:hypothetical protein